MKNSFIAIIIFCCTLAILPFSIVGSASGSDTAKSHIATAPVSETESEHEVPDFFVPPPPFSEDIFPCSECHADMEPDPTRRELEEHTEIAESFSHARQQRWCLDCHNPDDRDKLRLANGQLISFEESYYLCGQCHGTIFRDWKAGVHGKRTGEWNGKKMYRLCVHCHNPHHPKFAPLTPLPPPNNPLEIQNKRKLPDDRIPRNPIGDIQ